MNLLLFTIYRYFLVPVAVVTLPFLSLFYPKIREGFRLRRQKKDFLPNGQRPIWIHAASGEFEYAKSVIRGLKESAPGIPIVVTYFSPTFAKVVKDFPDVDRSFPLPIDLPGSCRSFLHKINPRVLLVARTDLWPELLEQCSQLKIPVILFSYTQKTFQSPLKKLFTRWTFHWIRTVYCVSLSDKQNLAPLKLKTPVEVMGDTRYDQVGYRLSHPKPISPSVRPKGDIPCFVAGSTWPQDEAVLIRGLASLLRANSLRLILVPHEPTKAHLQDLEVLLDKFSLKYAYFSAMASWDDADVLIVDKTGHLADLYSWGQFAFVGGSFRKSVHSVMEAIGAGCLTFVGPMHENNREALEFKSLPIAGRHGLEVIHTATELQLKVQKALNDRKSLERFAMELRSEFQRRMGASAKLIAKIQEYL